MGLSSRLFVWCLLPSPTQVFCLKQQKNPMVYRHDLHWRVFFPWECWDGTEECHWQWNVKSEPVWPKSLENRGEADSLFLSIFWGRSTYEFPYHLTLMMAIHPTRFFRVWMSISDSYTHGVFIWVGTLQSVTLWYSIGTPPIQRWQTMITFWLFSRSYRRSPFFIGRSW